MIKSSKSNTNTIFVVMMIAYLGAITIGNIRGGVRDIFAAFALLLFLLQNVESKGSLLFFFTPFTTDLKIEFIGIPFITILQTIFIISVIYKKYPLNTVRIITIALLCALQIPSMIFYNQTFLNVGVFFVNMMILEFISAIAKTSGRDFVKDCEVLFLIGLVIALIGGIVRDARVASWIRFAGLWTDPNFLGFFALLGIVACVSLSEYKLSRILMFSPIIILCIYTGYLTESRTFIWIIVILFGAIVLDALGKRNTSVLSKIAIILAIIIGAYLFYKYVWMHTVEQRGLISNNADWSNGRFRDSDNLINYWKAHIPALLFGIGVNNSLSVVRAASHNTYLDFILYFGLMDIPILLAYLFSLVRDNTVKKINIHTILQDGGLYIVVILAYFGTISMLSTDVVYMFIGLSSYIGKSDRWEASNLLG